MTWMAWSWTDRRAKLRLPGLGYSSAWWRRQPGSQDEPWNQLQRQIHEAWSGKDHETSAGGGGRGAKHKCLTDLLKHNSLRSRAGGSKTRAKAGAKRGVALSRLPRVR